MLILTNRTRCEGFTLTPSFQVSVVRLVEVLSGGVRGGLDGGVGDVVF